MTFMRAFIIAIIVTGLLHSTMQKTMISREAYGPILEVVAKGESGGNYNAYFGNGANTTLRFTDMTIQEVMEWQANYVEQGSPSNAVGKYQIIGPTLSGLVQELHISVHQRFDARMQDKMAVALINRRGAENFIKGKLSKEQFAANLSMEWASLPKVVGPNADQSYYAGDGLNKAHIARDEILAAVGNFESLA